MKPIGPTIKRYLEENKIKQKELAEKIGMAPGNLSTLLSKTSMDAEKLEKICRAIKLSPMTFFEMGDDEGSVVIYADVKDVTGSSNVGNTAVHIGAKTADRIIKEKEKLLMEKDKRIEEKERTIQILMAASGLNVGSNSGQKGD